MLETALLEGVVNTLLATAREWFIERRPRHFDFVVHQPDGRRIAIEVIAPPTSASKLEKLRKYLASAEPPISELLLISAEAPSSAILEQFRAVFQGLPSRWIGLNDLPAILGADSPGDLRAPETIEKLQWQALVQNVSDESNAPVSRPPSVMRPNDAGNQEAAHPLYLALTRQLPFSVINTIRTGNAPIEEVLQFGRVIRNATVVLSDIKNFSSLVIASRAEELNEMMSRYYRRTREAVFQHGGMLDKFIGDAVLAVFGYPYASAKSAVDAIRFSEELVQIGSEVLSDWSGEINAVIDSGTRVGIATGDIWPLNIGQQNIEISLLGDTINLAARLEKNCLVNGVLMDNRTRTRALNTDRAFLEDLHLSERELNPADAKGQQFQLRAWQAVWTDVKA
ncbi:MAG TPA: adenylate/guanylate cyclase domain-containing protein [Longimicrobium sp.]|nr:adenylate/guanylate cyclase domain-containing protein [Longimicrobium sp.]